MKENQRKLKLYHLWMLMAQTVDVAMKLRESELQKYNISRRESAVLYIVHANANRVTPAIISRYLARKSHSISELLNRMEKKGLVTRVSDLDKKNLVRIALTEKGKRSYSCSTKIESFSEITGSLSEEEYNQLESILKRIRSKGLESIGLSHRSIWPGTR